MNKNSKLQHSDRSIKPSIQRQLLFLSQKEDFDSEDDKSPEEKYVEEMSKIIPQGTDKTPEVLDSALQGLSARLVSHK